MSGARAAGLSPMSVPPREFRPMLLALVAACAGLLACAPGAAAVEAEAPPPAAPAPAATPAPLPVEVTLSTAGPGRPVPARFLGLSFEAQALDQLGALAGRGDLVTLLRSLGPGLIRFGGITADQNVAWTDPLTPRPAWATSTIGPAQMKAIGELARRSGWGVLLTVGMAHYEPEAAAREVASARAALGSRLVAVEVGNEPDAYGRHGFRPLPWIAQGYEEQVSQYREVIARLVPGVPLAGPDVSGSGIFPEWGFADGASQAPLMLTGHHYPLGCAQTPPPSIETLLSPAIRGREAQSLETYLSISRPQGIPFRMDEANSVSCGGVPGISNTFASALWAAGYVGQAMTAGIVGVNLQGNPINCVGYTPLCASDTAALAAGRLRAQPDWYALLLTRSLIGSRPLLTTIASTGTPNLAAYGFAGPDHTRKLLLVDDEAPGSSPLAVRAPLGPGFGVARVLRLTGPSLAATSGILLGGRAVPASGEFVEPARGEQATLRGGVLSLRVEPASAALVTVASAPRKKPRRRHGRH